MPSDNVLVQFTTAANLAGVDALKASMLGLSVQTIGLAALLFAVFEIGKAGVDNFKKQSVATDELTQAYATQKDTLAAHREEIQRFLDTNAAFISDQYDTQEAMASVIRAGYDTKDMLKIMGDALDLAAIKHVPVSDAEKTLLLALTGNKRGLKELGITSEEYDKIMKNKTLTTAQKHAALLKLIEDRTKGGRDAIDSTTQKQSELNKHWEDFTARIGPGVLGVWDKLIEAADTFVQLLDLTVQFLEKIGSLQSQTAVNAGHGAPGPHGVASGSGDSAHAIAGQIGGFRGPSNLHVHIHGGVFMDSGPTIDRLANVLVERLGYAPGT